MQEVPLAANANQQLSFNADGSYWQLSVYQGLDTMCADVMRDGVPLITGVRCYVGQGILPYEHLYKPNYGNLVFDNVPDWTTFGTACRLFYMPQAEYTAFQKQVGIMS